jgi:hypothetical protein
MTNYYISHTGKSKPLLDWMLTLPNLVTAGVDSGRNIKAEFNHTPAQQEDFVKALALKTGGTILINDITEITLGNFIDRVLTDQSFYSCEFNPGITKTNIGLTYVNIFTDFSGRPFFIDTTGFKSMAIQILWTKVGTGVQTVRIVNDADNTQVLESGGLGNTPGASDDFPNVAIPPAFLKFKGKWRLQAKSTVAADDPIFVGIRLYLRRD